MNTKRFSIQAQRHIVKTECLSARLTVDTAKVSGSHSLQRAEVIPIVMIPAMEGRGSAVRQ